MEDRPVYVFPSGMSRPCVDSAFPARRPDGPGRPSQGGEQSAPTNNSGVDTTSWCPRKSCRTHVALLPTLSTYVTASEAHVPPATRGAWWSVAQGKQSPGRQGDCFAACGGSPWHPQRFWDRVKSLPI